MADDRPPKKPTSKQKPHASGLKPMGKQPLPQASAAYQQASRLAGAVPLVKAPETQSKQSATGYGSGSRRGRSSRHPRPEGDVIGPHDEIIFEFGQRGDFVQVHAMHVPTLTEVAVLGPTKASTRELEQLALSKLRFVLRKQLEQYE